MNPIRHPFLPQLVLLLCLFAGAGTAALAASHGSPSADARRPASLFEPELAKESFMPPQLPPLHGIDVPNHVTLPVVRYHHGNPELGRNARYDRPQPKARSPKGRRGVPFATGLAPPADAAVVPWSAKLFGTAAPLIGSINYDTNGVVTSGGAFIPPDPYAAVGPNHVVAVTNVAFAIYNKSGARIGDIRSLRDFFGSLSPQTFTFDPKVLWDEHAQRFLLVTLEQTDTASGQSSNTSYIFLAVSASADPTGTWYRTRIDAKRTFGSRTCWGDYPGFGFDEQAVYVALNMFEFGSNESCDRSLLWIVNKAGSGGGLYAGATADVRQIDPYNVFGAQPLTTQVARIRGAPPSGSIGTWLVGFDGLTSGTTDFLQVARIDNPLGSSPSVFVDDVSMGNVAGGPVPLATQPEFAGIDAGDRRALDAAWRANQLWVTFTTNPPGGTNQNEATAHWVAVNTVGSSSQWFVQDQGDIGGEQLGSNTHTYYPSINVNDRGDVVVGFSASGSPSLEAGAYAVSRRGSDPAGTMSAPITIRAGIDPYLRTFGGENAVNRWGDYSSVAHDPVDQCFWVYNQYAEAQGSTSGNENGRWGTAAGRVCVCDGDEASGDTDLDGRCNNVDACPNDASNTCADVTITKTDDRTTVNAGAAITYTIVASNRGGSPASGASVVDNFPAPLGNCSWTCTATPGSSCPGGGSGNIAASVTLAPNGSATFTASCTVSPTASGLLSNTAAVTLAGEANTTNNAATDSNTTIVPRADLRITKSDGLALVDAGGTVQYAIVASNLSSVASTGTVADTFATPLAGCTWTCSAGAGSACPASGSGNIAAPVTLAANGSATFAARCTVAANATGTLSNTATIVGANDATTANNTATDSNTAIRPQADVTVSVTDGVAIVNAGASLVYTIVARNLSANVVTNVSVADTFPSPLTGCAWTCSASAGSSCSGGSGALAESITLAANGTATYTVTCAVPASAAASTLSNAATIGYANDPVASNDSASDTDTVVRPRADLSITVSDGLVSVDAGRQLAYTIVASNPSALAIAGALVTDAFPPPLTACTWRCTPSSGSACNASGSGNLTETVALAPNGSATFVATCRVPISATGTLSNTASIAYGNDPSATNDVAQDTDTVIVPPVFADGFE